MANQGVSTTYIDFSAPAVSAGWLNDLNNFYYNWIGSNSNAAYGAGMVGWGSGITYPAGSVGAGIAAAYTEGALGVTNAAQVQANLSTYETLLSGSTGSNQIGFLRPSVTGNSAQLVQQKLAEIYVDASEFGVTGNGTTDDTTALQNAINYTQLRTRPDLYASSTPSLGPPVLRIPAGLYKITAPLVITYPITIEGDGFGEYSKGTRLRNDGTGDLIQVNPISSGISVGFRGMTLFTQTAGTGYLINMTWTGGSGYANSNRIENCVFTNGGTACIRIVGDDTTLTNVVFDVAQSPGLGNCIQLGDTTAGNLASNVRVTNCNFFYAISRSFLAYRYRGVSISNCCVSQSGAGELYFFDAANTTPPAGQADALTIANIQAQTVQQFLAIGVNVTDTTVTNVVGYGPSGFTLSQGPWIANQSGDLTISDVRVTASFGTIALYSDFGNGGNNVVHNLSAINTTYSGTALTVSTSGGGRVSNCNFTGFTNQSIAERRASSGTAYNPGAVAAGATVSLTRTIAGAAIGDRVELYPVLGSWPVVPGIDARAFVSAANTVTVAYRNVTTASITPTAHDWWMEVIR